jgi:hypothetical protein
MEISIICWHNEGTVSAPRSLINVPLNVWISCGVGVELGGCRVIVVGVEQGDSGEQKSMS